MSVYVSSPTQRGKAAAKRRSLARRAKSPRRRRHRVECIILLRSSTAMDFECKIGFKFRFVFLRAGASDRHYSGVQLQLHFTLLKVSKVLTRLSLNGAIFS